MQKYQRRVKVQEEDGEVGCSSFTQIFKIGCLSIVHQNTVEIQHSINNNKEFQVVNQFATAKDNKVTKITQILCSDRSIRITDKITTELCRQVEKKVGVLSAEQVAGEGREGQKGHKVLMKKKATVGKLGEKEKGRDMRSVVKNIFRMFLHWVDNSTPPNFRLSHALKAHLNIIGKYNNHLIVSISKKEPLRKAFLTFCSTEAQQYIANSKIYDKQAHIQALNVYLRMCKEENTDKIKIQEDDGDKIIKVSTGGNTGCGEEMMENQNNHQNG